ncbi:hypothetical protein NDU88_005742 [Pleurodeles waltl]|uniref:Uncharacterized protein n=1 Tax=Pleurodeles waltl TaxID=8319 RepID=A0AAV7TWE2_PLEWA|nr:hypothetical protein NDU88_005742 [Pleurodeles waltl]
MPGGRSSNKHLGKPARQLLFSEALQQTRTPSPASQEHPTNQSLVMVDTSQGATMDRILQEISVVGRRLEGMDSMMTSLTEDTKSMSLDIAGFQTRVTALEQRVATVETQFQRAHRLIPKRRDGANHPRPIIACFLRHTQARQLLQKARMQGPFHMNNLQIWMTADFSKETSEHREAFLALRPRLRQLEIKFGLFEPARMWIIKNNVSKDLYDPTDLSLYLDSFSDRPMDTASRSQPQALITTTLNSLPKESALEQPNHDPSETLNRGRDLERLSKNHDDRGQVLHAVAKYTQVTDRDKSCSPLKPSPAPT